jgi:hypothetical protein
MRCILILSTLIFIGCSKSDQIDCSKVDTIPENKDGRVTDSHTRCVRFAFDSVPDSAAASYCILLLSNGVIKEDSGNVVTDAWLNSGPKNSPRKIALFIRNDDQSGIPVSVLSDCLRRIDRVVDQNRDLELTVVVLGSDRKKQ